MALLNLGRTLATPGALAVCSKHDVSPAELLSRHASGDWGELCADDVKANVDAIAFDDRVLSSYMVGGEKLYVITEWDRSSTTLLLAREY